MNASSRRSVRSRAFLAGVLALLLAPLPAALAAGDAEVVRLLPAAGQSGEIAAQVGQPVELVVVKSRGATAASGKTSGGAGCSRSSSSPLPIPSWFRNTARGSRR